VTERAARPRPAGAQPASGAFRRWLAFWAAFLRLCFTVAKVAAIYTRITRNDAAVNPIVSAGDAALVAVCSRRVAAQDLHFASANLVVTCAVGQGVRRGTPFGACRADHDLRRGDLLRQLPAVHRFASLFLVGFAFRAGGRTPVAGRSQPWARHVCAATEAA